MDRKGLTLIEIMLVVAIMGLLSVSVAVAFRSGATAWSKAGSRLEMYQNARVALDQISRDLAAAIAIDSTNTMIGEDGAGPNSSDKLNFFTTSGDDIYEIFFDINGADLDAVLRRAYAKNPEDYDCDDVDTTSETADEVGTDDVAYGISDIQLKYWDTGTNGWDTDALTAWGSSKTYLPEAVKITVETSYRHELTGDMKTRNFETVVYLPSR